VNDIILTEIYYAENPRLNNAYSEFAKVSFTKKIFSGFFKQETKYS